MTVFPVCTHVDYEKGAQNCLVFHCRFLLLSLEPDHNCGYDYVEVRDGDALRSPVIGRFCGDQLPPPIKSSGSALHILFSSDGYNNFNGFALVFQESAGRYSHDKQSSMTPLTQHKVSLLNALHVHSVSSNTAQLQWFSEFSLKCVSLIYSRP